MKKQYTEVEKLEHAKKHIEEKIRSAQDSCPHPIDKVTSTNGANTDNWDPHENRYWCDHYCEICHKRWREDLTRDKKYKDENVILWLLQHGYVSTKRLLNGQGYYIKES